MTDDEEGAVRLGRDGHAAKVAGAWQNARHGAISRFTFPIKPAGWGVIFERLQLWIDPIARSGPEVMAVDECLLQIAKVPVLRIYRWLGAWGSLGYFGNLATSQATFPELNWVRRWTGGGVVDHRHDWTYSLVIPQGEPLAAVRGVASYRLIHQCLAVTLATEEIGTRLSDGEMETGQAACFENPVHSDLLGDGGLKLAGAGQRRSRCGLLHQGSVASPCRDAAASSQRARTFAQNLCRGVVDRFEVEITAHKISQRVVERYARDKWTNRR